MKHDEIIEEAACFECGVLLCDDAACWSEFDLNVCRQCGGDND